MHGADVKTGARGQGGDGDLAISRRERLEQVQGAIDGLHRTPGSLGRRRRLFHRAGALLCVAKA